MSGTTSSMNCTNGKEKLGVSTPLTTDTTVTDRRTAQYRIHGSISADELQRFSLDSLKMIREMDIQVQKISKIIDKKVEKMSSKNVSEESKRQINEEVAKLEKIIEILSTRKLQLALKNYDFIDESMKLLEKESMQLQNILVEHGYLEAYQNVNYNEDLKSIGYSNRNKRKRGSGTGSPVPDVLISNHSSVNSSNSAGRADLANNPSINIDKIDTINQSCEIKYSETDTAKYNNEPVYCICKRVAFGDMIACDDDECPIEWFHYSCVNITRKPRSRWLCPDCTKKRKD